MQGNALSLLAVPLNSTFLKYILMADVRCQLLARQAHPSGCPAAAACAGEGGYTQSIPATLWEMEYHSPKENHTLFQGNNTFEGVCCTSESLGR